ncbi:uncharacterized protein LOC135375857 [Ornithodoros turicata]|uniref:uncharacterized protein LOC135375857 n=1 Tax=Ornithodoros turicata TaxID=34597 RepID=UPI0031398959
MHLPVILFSFGFYAVAESVISTTCCGPEAKDQVAWEMVKAMAEDSFYVFQTTTSQTLNCTRFEVNQTDENNHTATLVIRTRSDTIVTTVAAKGNQLIVNAQQEFPGSYPVLYTDNCTCGVFASPDEEEILLWVANRTALTGSYNMCCNEVFNREAMKIQNVTYGKFSEDCLESSRNNRVATDFRISDGNDDVK